MSQPSPYEFRDANEIIKHLNSHKATLGKWSHQRIETLDEIAVSGVIGNTFRAFRNMPKRPSIVFRNWALGEFRNDKTINELLGISSQEKYDKWAKRFSSGLAKAWQKQMDTAMPYGPSRKLPNLLMKCFVLWDDLTDRQRSSLLEYLHVPLDSFTLVAIRNCVQDLEIPKTATMKFVASETIYNQIQQSIRDVAYRAGVPAIYFDVLAWNMSR